MLARLQEKMILLHGDNKSANKPVLLRSLINNFDISSLERMIAKFFKVLASLSWIEPHLVKAPKETGFLTMRLI